MEAIDMCWSLKLGKIQKVEWEGRGYMPTAWTLARRQEKVWCVPTSDISNTEMGVFPCSVPETWPGEGEGPPLDH